MRRVTALLALLALVLTMLPAAALAAPQAGSTGARLQTDLPGQVAGSWIVTLRPGVDAASAAERLAKAHAGRVGFIYTAVLNGFSFHGSDTAAAALARNPSVRTVVANRAVAIVAQSVPTGVRRIDADDVNGVNGTATATGAGARVAILDTGIDLDHEDLAGNIDLASGKNCIDTSTAPNDGHSHGTHVAGTVAAINNTTGVVGVAPAATLIAVKVLDDSGSGSWESVICGINHVTALNAVSATAIDVANMSLGGSGSATGCTDGDLHQAICESVTSGTVYAVAAGNDSQNASGFVPAAYPEVLTVSAFQDTNGDETDAGCTGFAIFVTCDEEFASFSNFGSIVDVIAPGVNINSTVLNNGYGTKSGTSMAAPHAAGVAALVRSLDQSLTVAQVEAILEGTGQCPNNAQNDGDATCEGMNWDGDGDSIAEPMVNAAWAVAAVVGSGGGGGGGDPTNTAPAATDASPTTNEDTAVSIGLSGSDAETCELTFSIVSGPSNGTLGSITNASCTLGTPNTDGATVTYTPNPNYNGTDSFIYRVSDGSATDDGTVTVTVNPVNDLPVAVDDAYSTPANTPLSVSAPGVLGNDSDVDGDTLSAAKATDPENGTVTVFDSDGSFDYTPNSNFTGTDSFDYTASDGKGGTDTATVSITVGSFITIASITDLGSVNNGSSWTARVRVTITDTNGNPVPGATVGGKWTYNGTTVSDTCNSTTNSSGQCDVDLSSIPKKASGATITVTSVTHTTLAWDKVEKSLTVFKP